MFVVEYAYAGQEIRQKLPRFKSDAYSPRRTTAKHFTSGEHNRFSGRDTGNDTSSVMGTRIPTTMVIRGLTGMLLISVLLCTITGFAVYFVTRDKINEHTVHDGVRVPDSKVNLGELIQKQKHMENEMSKASQKLAAVEMVMKNDISKLNQTIADENSKTRKQLNDVENSAQDRMSQLNQTIADENNKTRKQVNDVENSVQYRMSQLNQTIGDKNKTRTQLNDVDNSVQDRMSQLNQTIADENNKTRQQLNDVENSVQDKLSQLNQTIADENNKTKKELNETLVEEVSKTNRQLADVERSLKGRISQLNQTFVEENNKTLNELNNVKTSMQNDVKALDTKLTDEKTRVNQTFEQLVTDFQNLLDDIEGRWAAKQANQTNKLDELESGLKNVSNFLNSVTPRLGEMATNLTEVKAVADQLSSNDTLVGFTVYSVRRNLNSGKVLFNQTLFNTGSYIVDEGVFRCPVAGLYSFSSTLMLGDTPSGGADVNCHYTIDGVQNAMIKLRNDSYDAASASINVLLAVGNAVAIECGTFESIWTIPSTMFSGMLIKPIKT